MEHPFRNITSGIEQAFTLDTIFVCNGTYFENIHLNKSVSLVGESKHSTIIDGSFTDAVVIMTANNISITDFTILNGGWNGNGVDVQHSANSVITNNIITNNTVSSNNGYGIYLYTSCNNNVITMNNISSNNGNGIWHGDGISLYKSSNNNIMAGNTVSSNNRYGIHLSGSSNNNITDNNISANSYGVYVTASNNNIINTNNIFLNGNDGIFF